MIALSRHLRLYLVTDPELCASTGLVETVRQAVAAGVTMVQLRDKTATTQARIEMALALKATLAGSDVPLVINDDVAAAVASDVDGAHIGQEDITAAEARALLGPDKVLGLSCETVATVQSADPGVVDYLGLGPVFGTPTKRDHKAPIGLDGLADLVLLSPVPTVAIGGLKADHHPAVLASGANGSAVVSAICGQSDIPASTRAFLKVESSA